MGQLVIGTISMSRVPRSAQRFAFDPYAYIEPKTQDHFIDTTTRAQHPLFAPGWDIVMGYKNGRISSEQYTAEYHRRMQSSYATNKPAWQQLLNHATQNNYALVLICFCATEAFCHRHLLSYYLKNVAECDLQIPVQLAGEWHLYHKGN